MVQASAVFREIFSRIKGSAAAINHGGALTSEMYCRLGRKSSATFSAGKGGQGRQGEPLLHSHTPPPPLVVCRFR